MERIVQHIQKDNPGAARDLAETIYEGASSLQNISAFPNRGRIGRRGGSRELVFEPYILVYRVRSEFVEISRVYHSAQDTPSE